MIVAVRDRRRLVAKAPNLWSRPCSSRPSLGPDPGARIRLAHSTRLRKYTVRRDAQKRRPGRKKMRMPVLLRTEAVNGGAPAPPSRRNAVRLSLLFLLSLA